MLSFAMPAPSSASPTSSRSTPPPIELAYTGLILVACFVFRDMTTSLAPASRRCADRSQPRRSVRHAARGRIRDAAPGRAPLMRPAIIARARVSFISAMTSDQRRDLPHEPALRHGDRQHRRRAEVGEYGYARGLCVGADTS
jgi:iron(III) transport system permease protein